MMMASIVTLPVLVFTMCLALLPIALLVVLQVFLCRKSRKLGLILPVLSLVLSFVLTSVALINCVTPAAAGHHDHSGRKRPDGGGGPPPA